MFKNNLALQLFTAIFFTITALYAEQKPNLSSHIPLDIDAKICNEHDAQYGRELQVGIEYESIFNLPLGCHRIISISPSDFPSEITIEDGSIWKIDLRQQDEALRWKNNDPILISQNSDLTEIFSSYDYKIINKRLRKSIRVNLEVEPEANNQSSRYIAAIDTEKKELMLDDGSIWHCNSSCIDKWSRGEGIIVGTNSLWFSSPKNILINIAIKNYTMGNLIKGNSSP